MTRKLRGKQGDIDAIIRLAGASPLALANVARTLLLSRGDGERARSICAEALAMTPDDPELRAIVAEVCSTDIGTFYFPMVLDSTRHAAYARSLGRALRSGGRVLDIGAGTGLFAMMAARAGADEVIACERKQAVAAAAGVVVAANDLQDRVKVVAKASTDLQVGIDMDGPADVLVWDNLTNDMLGAGALPAIEDAVRRLLKPGGQVIPARVAIKAALAEDRQAEKRRMSSAVGFDLTAFNVVAKPAYAFPCDSDALLIRSEATTIFDFDCQSGGPFRAERTLKPVIGQGGRANGVVQWLDFQLDVMERYTSAPGNGARAFGLEFHPTPSPFEAKAGEEFTIGASHDRDRIRLWLEAH